MSSRFVLGDVHTSHLSLGLSGVVNGVSHPELVFLHTDIPDLVRLDSSTLQSVDALERLRSLNRYISQSRR